MRTRKLGLIGAALVIVALIMGSLGPRLLPAAFGSGRSFSMMRPAALGLPATGAAGAPFDQRFLDEMITHHAGAIMSTKMMIANSQRPELRDLAQRIITAQQRELTQMREWRRAWYNTASVGDMQASMLEQMMNGGGMGPDQMRQMMGANADFDRMFLQMMIPHHRAAVTMAEQALAQAGRPEIKTLARQIITTQRAEITEMQGYLRAWYGETAS